VFRNDTISDKRLGGGINCSRSSRIVNGQADGKHSVQKKKPERKEEKMLKENRNSIGRKRKKKRARPGLPLKCASNALAFASGKRGGVLDLRKTVDEA